MTKIYVKSYFSETPMTCSTWQESVNLIFQDQGQPAPDVASTITKEEAEKIANDECYDVYSEDEWIKAVVQETTDYEEMWDE